GGPAGDDQAARAALARFRQRGQHRDEGAGAADMIEWALGWLWWALGVVGWALRSVVDLVVWYAKQHPMYAALTVFAFIRMWGRAIQTGQAGVLFVFGRRRKVLEPGFHPLIPVVQEVRKLPIRSVTIQLPPQRLASADGLVFDVDATLVMRISDPVK